MANTYETTITHVTDGRNKDAYVYIESSEPTVITALLAKDAFEVVAEDTTPGLPRLVRFRIPLARVNWGGLAKRQGVPGSADHLRGSDDSAA